MANAKLKYGDKEIILSKEVTTLGRASDNDVSFSKDSNISRYHAEVENRGGEFWLIELGSSNGTTVNGERVTVEKLLDGGDAILLGGSSKVEFLFEKDEKESAASDEQTKAQAASAAGVSADSSVESSQAKEEAQNQPGAQAAASNSKLPIVLGVAGVVCGLAVILVVAAVLISYSGTTKCEAKAIFTKPDNGETISESTEIEVEAENADCAARAIFLINGAEFASADAQPFKVSLDPKQFPELANGSLQSLQIVLEDAEGNKIVQPNELALAFETVEIATPTPTPIEIVEDKKPTSQNKNTKNVSGSDAQEMSKRLIKEFSGSFNYKFDAQFLQEVQKKTAEYAVDGYFARAQAYKDVINVAFVQEQNLDAPLGYVLAMSRSQFKPQKQGANESLWQINSGFATENAYNALCGTETLSDATQNCAAKSLSLYLKALVLGVFEGDTIYSVAAFGKSPQEANIWKASLPADRSDFWKVIKNPKQREEVVQFFAAGIVAENPQKFGLKKDRPISELYKNLMEN